MINRENTETTKTMYDVEVTRAKDITQAGKATTIAFDMIVNGVKVYGCTYREGVKNGKEWRLVDFPSVKGRDGEYYNRVWFPVSNELCEAIAKAIEQKL